jgi:Ser/Thr protein kinase RdoA (MazF antagonist)
MLNEILNQFGLDSNEYIIQKFGTGLINNTWKVADYQNNNRFILQQINNNVFKSPNDIAENISKVSKYLAQHHHDYLFVSPIPTIAGSYIYNQNDEKYFRLFPYVKNSITIDTVQTAGQASEAAKAFGRFTHLLADFDSAKLHYTLADFHNLTIRFKQFQDAVKTADKKRLVTAIKLITAASHHQDIAQQYELIIKHKLIPLRVIHHDTKISNILFNQDHKGLCVIDLDTVMPGYFISDVGDMMRTYLSPYNEEEQDFDKIAVREDIFTAIVQGYFMEMGAILTQTEKDLFVYAGKFMIYMQAIRFLTDYLNNDIYYQAKYPDHNLVRAKNQFTLLQKYIALEPEFQQIVQSFNR